MPAPVHTKRVTIEFPNQLWERTEEAASQMGMSRTAVIRAAVEEFLRVLHRRALEQALREGYAANAAMDRQISEEFAHVDSENT